MSTSPVVLFVYNRPGHAKQTLDALIRNELAQQSDLIVFSDGPKFADDVLKVKNVRDYLKTIKGFKSVSIVERGNNYGLSSSIISGVTEVVLKYERIIVLEDDMVTSPYFLRFMNDALNLYEREEQVISIHGYVYPIKSKLPETFFLKDTGCWGWGTWKRGWDYFEPNGNKLMHELLSRKLTKKFDLNGSFAFTKLLQEQIDGKNNSWAIRWQASAFLQNKVTLFPGESLLKNIGHDNSGAHCGATNCFDVELAKKPFNLTKIEIKENEYVLKELGKYFNSIKPNMKSRIIGMIKFMYEHVKFNIWTRK